MSNSLQPHEPQHARPPCPSPNPGEMLRRRPGPGRGGGSALRCSTGAHTRRSCSILSRVRLSILTDWQHARLPCPPLSPGVCPDSCPQVMPSSHLILGRPLLLLPSIFPSIRVFSSESALRIRWPKYWTFSFSISPSNEYSGLISFRID